MRYYDIEITNADTGALIQPSYFASLGLKSSYTSLVKGQSLTSALNIELDIPVAPYAQPRQGAFLRIWGISLQEMIEAGKLNFANITLSAGMQKGLPLANPLQAGVIMKGTIFQCFGNWRGTEMTLDMTLLPPSGTDNKPVNLNFNWDANTQLGPNLQRTLQQGFPKYTVPTPAISDLLKFPGPLFGRYEKLGDFATMVKKLTTGTMSNGIVPMGGGKYQGVDIIIVGNTIIAYDGTKDFGGATFANPTQIAFQDLIGQPTWISPTSINFACVLRSDIQVGDFVKMPPKLQTPYVLTTQQAAFPGTPARDQSSLQGIFRITEVHHFGNYRATDAGAWVTTYDAAFVNQGT